jgi:hypothetical protein
MSDTKRERIEKLLTERWWDCWQIVKHLGLTRNLRGLRLAAKLLHDSCKI